MPRDGCHIEECPKGMSSTSDENSVSHECCAHVFGLPCGTDYTAKRCEPSPGAVADGLPHDELQHAFYHPRSIDRALPGSSLHGYDSVHDLKSHGLRVKSCVDHVERRPHPWNCEVACNSQRDVRHHNGHDLALEDTRLGDGAGQLSRLTLAWFMKCSEMATTTKSAARVSSRNQTDHRRCPRTEALLT